MVFCLSCTVLDTEGRLSAVNFSQLQLFSFSEPLQVLWQCSRVRVALWRSVGIFLPFIIFFQVLEPAVTNSFLPNPGPRVSDFSPETVIWKLFEPVENQLRGFSPLILDQWEYCVSWTERFEYHYYHAGSI